MVDGNDRISRGVQNGAKTTFVVPQGLLHLLTLGNVDQEATQLPYPTFIAHDIDDVMQPYNVSVARNHPVLESKVRLVPRAVPHAEIHGPFALIWVNVLNPKPRIPVALVVQI